MRNRGRQYSDAELIARIKEDSDGLDLLYRQHQRYCLSYLNSLHNHDEMQDIFHDAVLAFYEKISKDEAFVLRCSIQTYLCAVCRNMLLERLRKENRFINFEDEFEHDNIVDVLEPIEPENSPKMKAIHQALSLMKETGGKCYEILLRFFYLKQGMDRIAYEMDYTNSDNAKNQKARCQKRLKILTSNVLFS